MSCFYYLAVSECVLGTPLSHFTLGAVLSLTIVLHCLKSTSITLLFCVQLYIERRQDCGASHQIPFPQGRPGSGKPCRQIFLLPSC
jgi:hypothetical protein